MSLLSIFKSRNPNGLGHDTTAEIATSGLNLVGKTILLTGCNSGLGLETMRVLAMRGATVIGAARTLDKAHAAVQSVHGQTLPMACDLADPVSIRACIEGICQKGIRLDAIVANAGIMALPDLEIAFGHELQFFTNHVGHFLLITSLLDKLTEEGRVVMLSSSAHRKAPAEGIAFDNLDGRRGYDSWRFYGQSKFANLLFAKELARRFAGTRKTANACHPGVIKTQLHRHMGRSVSLAMNLIGPLALKSIPQGAATSCYLAAHPDVATESGQYFADCHLASSRPDADDPVLAKKLWEYSQQLVARLPA